MVGRDILIVQLWRRLERQSITIIAERRMGKTSIVRDRMAKKPAPGWKVIYLDLSKCTTPLGFVQALLNEVRPLLSKGKQAQHRFKEFLSKLSGLEVDLGIGLKLPESLELHWKDLLLNLAEDVANLRDPRIALAFDELPLMLDAIKKRSPGDGVTGEAVVMEILDTLRAIRQECDLRMIYTGSLGLHHVLTVLREQGYQNEPANDMAVVDLNPLTHEDATKLVLLLLEGEGIVASDANALAAHLATVTDGIPFYIQKVVDEMALEGLEATPADVDRCLKERLRDLTDPWKLEYYLERIETHYPANLQPIAFSLLDQLAIHDAKSLTELFEGIDPEKIETDRESVRKVLSLLGLDHYIVANDTGYRFRLDFIRRVWQARRREN